MNFSKQTCAFINSTSSGNHLISWHLPSKQKFSVEIFFFHFLSGKINDFCRKTLCLMISISRSLKISSCCRHPLHKRRITMFHYYNHQHWIWSAINFLKVVLTEEELHEWNEGAAKKSNNWIKFMIKTVCNVISPSQSAQNFYMLQFFIITSFILHSTKKLEIIMKLIEKCSQQKFILTVLRFEALWVDRVIKINRIKWI